MPHPSPRIAVLTSDVLRGIGLRTILEKIIPMAEVRSFTSFAAFAAEEPDACFHYFVDLRLFLANRTFFTARGHKTILLLSDRRHPRPEGFRSIASDGTEEELVREILRLHHAAHGRGEHGALQPADTVPPLLTPREIEVLRLIVRGLINKEIAGRLSIGLTTVISHRRNIVEKLGIRTVSGLTIYAVMHGYVEVAEI